MTHAVLWGLALFFAVLMLWEFAYRAFMDRRGPDDWREW
jgi:hypothetical protein